MKEKYKVSRYVEYVKNKEKLLLLNCKNGAILLLDDNMYKLCQSLQQNIIETDIKDKYRELLIYDFVISSKRNEVEEAKQNYYLNKTNIFFSKEIFSITLKLYDKNVVIAPNNLTKFMNFIFEEIINKECRCFLLRLIINEKVNHVELKNVLAKLIKDSDININKFKINLQFDNCYFSDLVNALLPYMHSLTVDIEKNNKRLVNEVTENIKKKNIKCKINLMSELGQGFLGERDFDEKNLYCYDVDEIVSGVDNVGNQTVKEILDIESEVVKREGIKKLQWLRPFGLICEYSFQQTAFVDHNLNVFKCMNKNVKKYNLEELQNCFNNKEDKIFDECFNCKYIYMCFGKNCIIKDNNNFCPVKIHFIKDYLLQLLDNLLIKDGKIME